MQSISNLTHQISIFIKDPDSVNELRLQFYILSKKMYCTPLAQYCHTKILQKFSYRPLSVNQFSENDFLCTVVDAVHSCTHAIQSYAFNFSFTDSASCICLIINCNLLCACSLASARNVFSEIADFTFQNQMKLFNKLLSQSSFFIVDNHFDTSKMICGFNHIIYVENFIFHADGIGFKNIPGLIMGQTTSLNMV